MTLDLLSFETIQKIRMGLIDFDVYLDELEVYYNENEPEILAFIPEDNRFARIRQEANALLEQYPNPMERPALFGLLVGVKDIFHVDGFTTRGGSNVPPEAIQGAEAPSVTALKQAGAIIMGKTVTTEFAYFAPGPTRNPFNAEHTPGGSSSGSAAAVGGGLVPLAFGTQTIGSVTRPASFCGTIGYKPSYNRIEKSGVIPLSTSLDHVGFFTEDLWLAEEAASLLAKNWQEADLDKSKLTIGVPIGPYLAKADPEMLAVFEAILAKIESAGHTIKRIELFLDIEDIIKRHALIVAAEAAQTHQVNYEKYPTGYDPKTIELIERGLKISENDLDEARAGREALRTKIIGYFESEALDIWLSPSAPGPAPKGLASTGDPIMNLPWTHSGLPTLGLPMGYADGLPLGLQLTGQWMQDELLFKIGYLIEAELKA